MKKRVLESLIVLVAGLFLCCFAYIYDYYPATAEGLESLDSGFYLEIESNDMIIFPVKNAEKGIIFYPGGKVQCEAYAPLMAECAKEGILCVLVQMPGNLAVLQPDAANGIEEHFPDIREWYMAGHSLGGSMAASYISGADEEYKGLILLAAYSASDLRESDMKVLSLYGSEDKVLNMDKYEEYKVNLPENYTEFVIDGGCHAYFGSYGEQDGDGEPIISPERQIKITVDQILKFIE